LLQKYENIERIILLARRQPLNDIFEEIEKFGNRIELMLADLSNKEQVVMAIKKISQKWNSISIIHSAGVADDTLLQSQNIQRFSRVFDAKCKGLLNLSHAVDINGLSVKRWILNSSVSSVLGNVGQSNYAASNGFLDAFAHMHSNTLSVNWANWLETGFAANTHVAELLRQKGFYGLKTDEALECFDWILSHGSRYKQLFIARADWSKIFEFRPDLRVIVQNNLSTRKELDSQLLKLNSTSNTFKVIPLLSIQQIKIMLEVEIKKLLKLDPTEDIDKCVGFMELGLDSFGMFNLSNLINRYYGQTLVNIINLFEHSNIESLALFIHSKLTQEDQQQPASSKIEKQTESGLSEVSKQSEKQNEEEISKLGPSTALKTSVSFAKTMKKPKLVFIFAGHGSLYNSVCLDLCTNVPYIEEQIDKCSKYFHEHLKLSIKDIILSGKTDESQLLVIEHAVIFTIGYSLAKFWIHVGLEPAYLIGHSLGELIAVCIAGYLELKDAIHLVYLRAKALARCKGKGAMMAVSFEFSSRVDEFALSVAAINGPKQIVVSGITKNIEKAKNSATKQALSTKMISTEYAFHSKLIKEKYLKDLNAFDWSKVHKAHINVISNVTAEPIVTFDRHYVKLHATSTVQFWKSIENLLKEGEITILEVGPGKIMSSLVQKILNEHSLRYLVLNTIEKDQPNELDSIKCELKTKSFF
jgi:malonyl CoA-acyl carrier protein transacylase